MRSIFQTSQFKKNFKKLKSRGKDIEKPTRRISLALAPAFPPKANEKRRPPAQSPSRPWPQPIQVKGSTRSDPPCVWIGRRLMGKHRISHPTESRASIVPFQTWRGLPGVLHATHEGRRLGMRKPVYQVQNPLFGRHLFFFICTLHKQCK